VGVRRDVEGVEGVVDEGRIKKLVRRVLRKLRIRRG
jgi:hypothetical protein